MASELAAMLPPPSVSSPLSVNVPALATALNPRPASSASVPVVAMVARVLSSATCWLPL
jgi:hypothetical protein